MWCLSLAAGALATRFIPFRAHGVWHMWPTVAAAAIGLVAVGFSVYVVYVLEIVKVANRTSAPPDGAIRCGRAPDAVSARSTKPRAAR